MEDIMHIQSSFLRGVAARTINKAVQKQGYKSTEVKLNDIFAGYSEDEKRVHLHLDIDAIGFRMTPEQVLYYSGNCFGTADSITFKNNLLRIHDLKTGAVPAHMEQLFIYDALFCLEYRVHPQDIQIENRIYQNDDVFTVNPTEAEIKPIMDKIIEFDKIITELKLGEAA